MSHGLKVSVRAGQSEWMTDWLADISQLLYYLYLADYLQKPLSSSYLLIVLFLGVGLPLPNTRCWPLWVPLLGMTLTFSFWLQVHLDAGDADCALRRQSAPHGGIEHLPREWSASRLLPVATAACSPANATGGNECRHKRGWTFMDFLLVEVEGFGLHGFDGWMDEVSWRIGWLDGWVSWMQW